MELILRDKFRRSKELREKLALTQKKKIVFKVSDAVPSNLYWGRFKDKGQNQLGRLLELIRDDIQHNNDLEKWLQFSFKLIKDPLLCPSVELKVMKEGKHIETISLSSKSYYLFGQLKTNHVILAHPSISRQHAAIIIQEQSKVSIIDLGSKSKTFLNDNSIDEYKDIDLKNNDVIKFAVSTRDYIVKIDYSKVNEYLNRKAKEIEFQIQVSEK